MSYESGELYTDFTQSLLFSELSEMSETTRARRLQLAHAYKQCYRTIVRQTPGIIPNENERLLLRELDVDERDSVDLMKAGLSARFIRELEHRASEYDIDRRVGEDAMFGVHWVRALGQYLIPSVHTYYRGADSSLDFSFILIYSGEYPDLTDNQIATLEACADRKIYTNSDVGVTKSYQ